MKKVALVTGGARGIGLGIARVLAEEGFDLLLCGTRNLAEVEQVLGGLQAPGRMVRYHKADVSLAHERRELEAVLRAEFGALHLLVNNAGVAPLVREDILEASEASFERVMRINLQGPYFLTQSLAKWMIAQRMQDPAYRGCIVNIGSISAGMVSLNRGEYCLSKAGVASMTQLFAARLGEYDLPVYEVRPGITRSDMTAPAAERYDKLIRESDTLLLKRWGEPEDVGRAVAMLARGDLAYATGQVINLDGGLTLARF